MSDDFKRSDAGYPLGRGMPSGSPLREDGETHRDAWKRILRGDPCAYCGVALIPCPFTQELATVDHIIPRSRARPGEAHVWANYTGACVRCNGAKRDEPLLLWLARRRVLLRS